MPLTPEMKSLERRGSTESSSSPAADRFREFSLPYSCCRKDKDDVGAIVALFTLKQKQLL